MKGPGKGSLHTRPACGWCDRRADVLFLPVSGVSPLGVRVEDFGGDEFPWRTAGWSEQIASNIPRNRRRASILAQLRSKVTALTAIHRMKQAALDSDLSPDEAEVAPGEVEAGPGCL